MNSVDKLYFKHFMKKHRNSEAIRELHDYICLLEDRVTELERIVALMLSKQASEDSQN